jgi:hypothetical protein
MLCSMSNYLSQSYVIIMVQLFVCSAAVSSSSLSFHSHFLFFSLSLYPVNATRFHARMWPASSPALDIKVMAFKNVKLCACILVVYVTTPLVYQVYVVFVVR